jgi:hypothetical protein
MIQRITLFGREGTRNYMELVSFESDFELSEIAAEFVLKHCYYYPRGSAPVSRVVHRLPSTNNLEALIVYLPEK